MENRMNSEKTLILTGWAILNQTRMVTSLQVQRLEDESLNVQVRASMLMRLNVLPVVGQC